MRQPTARPAILAGAAVAVIYAIAASVSGSLSPLARLPLLDGVHSAPPYNWVQAPQGEQGSGTPPASASQRVAIGPTGNRATTIATSDGQASLNIADAGIGGGGGRRAAEVKIEPLDPAAYAAPPASHVVRGNVYRIAIRGVPGGAGIPSLNNDGQLTLSFASPTARLLKARHTVMFSTDGQNWRLLGGQEQHGTQKVSVPFVDIGYYAVVAKVPPAEPDEGGGFPWIILIVVAVAAGSAFAITTRIRRAREEAKRRARIREELARKSRSTKKRRR